jgi:hypothetical protein
MKKKFWVSVKEVDQAKVIELLRKADIRYTNKNGMFIFDAVSTLIGFIVGSLLFGILFK